jgi:O-antigen/teichoic acid export membrane protein
MVNTLALRRFASLGSRGMASIGDQAAAAAAGFVVSVYIGRRIGVDALGVYAISNALVLLVRALQSAVVLEPMAVLGPRKAGEYDSYFGFLVGLQVLTVLLFSLIFAGVSAFAHVYDYLDTQAFFVMLASCLYVNFLCFQLFLRRQFYVDHCQYMAALQSVSFLALVIAGLAAFWQVEGLTVVDVYTLLTICSVAVCLVQGGRFWSRVGRPSAAEVRQHVHDHWAFGKWILLAVPFGILSYQGFFPFVGFAVSEEAAGLLKAAEALVAPFVQVVIGMQLMLVPMTSRNVDSMPLAEQKKLAVNISRCLSKELSGKIMLRLLF